MGQTNYWLSLSSVFHVVTQSNLFRMMTIWTRKIRCIHALLHWAGALCQTFFQCIWKSTYYLDIICQLSGRVLSCVSHVNTEQSIWKDDHNHQNNNVYTLHYIFWTGALCQSFLPINFKVWHCLDIFCQLSGSLPSCVSCSKDVQYCNKLNSISLHCIWEFP